MRIEREDYPWLTLVGGLFVFVISFLFMNGKDNSITGEVIDKEHYKSTSSHSNGKQTWSTTKHHYHVTFLDSLNKSTVLDVGCDNYHDYRIGEVVKHDYKTYHQNGLSLTVLILGVLVMFVSGVIIYRSM